MKITKLDKVYTLVVDGEEVAYVDQIIEHNGRNYYGVDGEIVDDNGEAIPVGGFGVELK